MLIHHIDINYIIYKELMPVVYMLYVGIPSDSIPRECVDTVYAWLRANPGLRPCTFGPGSGTDAAFPQSTSMSCVHAAARVNHFYGFQSHREFKLQHLWHRSFEFNRRIKSSCHKIARKVLLWIVQIRNFRNTVLTGMGFVLTSTSTKSLRLYFVEFKTRLWHPFSLLQVSRV